MKHGQKYVDSVKYTQDSHKSRSGVTTWLGNRSNAENLIKMENQKGKGENMLIREVSPEAGNKMTVDVFGYKDTFDLNVPNVKCKDRYAVVIELEKDTPECVEVYADSCREAIRKATLIADKYYPHYSGVSSVRTH